MFINKMKKIYKELLYGYRGTSESYLKYLKKKGVKIGENVTFYEPNTNYIDVQKPWIVKIGNNVEIARGVVIITHDYAWSVIKQINGEIIGSRGKVEIGNNVFIGMNTMIMQGVNIGDNVIIGANTLVNKDIPANSVAVGNPVRVVSSIEDYTKKRKIKYIEEAKELFLEYYKKYNKIPDKEIFDEFFWIFEKRNLDNLPREFTNKMELTGNWEMSKNKFLNTEPDFEGYEKFVEYCMKGETN